MQIEIVNVNVEDKGKYKQATVAYRSNGKLSEKKLMSFGAGTPSFEVLQTAKAGEVYDIVAAKNNKGFWDWTSASKGIAGTEVKPAQTGGTATPRGSYETPEERAIRQKLIVRQSSLSNALEFFTLTKKAPTVESVTEVADAFVAYVFNTNNNGMQGVLELEDDIPL